MKPFYVYKRNNSNYYVQFVDPLTHRLTTPRSTGQKSYDAALSKAYEWMYSGAYKKPVLASETRLLDYLRSLRKAGSVPEKRPARMAQKDAGCSLIPGGAEMKKMIMSGESL